VARAVHKAVHGSRTRASIATIRYIGRRAYLLTICTFQRVPILTSATLVESLLMQFRQCAIRHQFANHAYSFMPDHVHFVLEGIGSVPICVSVFDCGNRQHRSTSSARRVTGFGTGAFMTA
jgi:REP element-mobilizing transposase RayT